MLIHLLFCDSCCQNLIFPTFSMPLPNLLTPSGPTSASALPLAARALPGTRHFIHPKESDPSDPLLTPVPLLKLFLVLRREYRRLQSGEHFHFDLLGTWKIKCASVPIRPPLQCRNQYHPATPVEAQLWSQKNFSGKC